MNKFMKYMSYALLFGLVFVATGAMAQGDGSVFDLAIDKTSATFESVRAIIYIVGGFGLVGLGFAAIFGKVHWKWLAALAIGLAIVAAAGYIVEYVTYNSDATGRDSSQFYGQVTFDGYEGW